MSGIHEVTFSARGLCLEARCDCGWLHRWSPSKNVEEWDYGLIFAYGLDHTRKHANDRPTRSEHSLEGAAVNGLTPVGQEDAP